MRFLSTRQAEGADGVSFSEAAMQGLAQDGGLFVPESLPGLEPRQPAATSRQLEAEPVSWTMNSQARRPVPKPPASIMPRQPHTAGSTPSP